MRCRISVLFFSTWLWVLPAFALDPSATVLTLASGEVLLDGKPFHAKAQKLSAGQVVETKAGKASIIFGTQSVAHLDQNTRFEVKQTDLKRRKIEVELPVGRTRILVRSGGMPKEFKVRTRSATMGVRGTHILVDAPTNQPPRFTTFEGRAALEIPGRSEPLVLGANQSMQVAAAPASTPAAGGSPQKGAPEAAPAPEALSDSQVREALESVGGAPELETASELSIADGSVELHDSFDADAEGEVTLQPGFGFGTNGTFGFTGSAGGAFGGLDDSFDFDGLDPVANAELTRLKVRVEF